MVNSVSFSSVNGRSQVFSREILFFLYNLHILHTHKAAFVVLENSLRMGRID